MKILNISIYPENGKKHSYAGGVASYTYNLTKSIPYEEIDSVYVLCNKIKGKYVRYKDDNLNIIRCFDKNINFLFQLSRELDMINPDIIHIQQELALFGGPLTAYLLQWLVFFQRKRNIIITLHGVVSIKSITKKFIEDNNSSLPVWFVRIAFLLIYRPLCIWAKKIIVHEKYLKEVLVSEYGVNGAKIIVIHHGIENLKIIDRQVARKKIGVGSRKNVVLFMGYLTGYKGVDMLIEGFALYAKKDKNSLLIIGAGKHPRLKNNINYIKIYNNLFNKAKELIPSSQYKWIGFIDEDDLKYYFSAADLSVYPYTIAMASSGPMAMSIGYGRPFLINKNFNLVDKADMLFDNSGIDLAKKLEIFFKKRIFDMKYLETMRKIRLWPNMGKQVYNLYKITYNERYY